MSISTSTTNLTGITNSSNDCLAATSSKSTTDSCAKEDYVLDESTGKYVCGGIYLGAAALTSLASVALTLY